MQIEPGDSWFSAKTIEVVRPLKASLGYGAVFGRGRKVPSEDNLRIKTSASGQLD